MMYVTASLIYSGEIKAQRACVIHLRSYSWHVADLVVESMMSTLRGDTTYILLSCVQKGPPVPAWLLSVSSLPSSSCPH